MASSSKLLDLNLNPDERTLKQFGFIALGGFGLELADLESFRTWGSKNPGHPEYGHTKPVETTTGPLGQGVANAVGLAMAARYERGLFDPDAPVGESPFDHRQQLRRLDWLQHEIGTQFAGFGLEAAVGVASDDDDRDPLRVDCREVKTVELRQTQIGDDQIGSVRRKQIESIGHRRRLGDVVSSARQELSHATPRGVVVFDDKNSESHTPRQARDRPTSICPFFKGDPTWLVTIRRGFIRM